MSSYCDVLVQFAAKRVSKKFIVEFTGFCDVLHMGVFAKEGPLLNLLTCTQQGRPLFMQKKKLVFPCIGYSDSEEKNYM